MPDFDVKGGLSGAASGAGTGAAIGSVVPGVGTAIGAGVGAGLGALGGGFFGGDDEMSPARKRAIRENENLLAMMESRYRDVQQRDPAESRFFQAAQTQSREQIQRQADRDASTAAARGLTGSQFEVAQASARQAELGQQQTQAIGQSVEQQRQRERMALRQMLRQRGNLNNLLNQQAQLETQREISRNKQLQSSLAALGPTLAGMGGGGGSSGG